MAEKTLVKTTTDGVEIWLNQDTGRFEAKITCECSYGHRSDCKRMFISRSSLTAVVRELDKRTAPPPTGVKAIDVNEFGNRTPRLIEIIAVEPQGGYKNDRYRAPSGALHDHVVRAYVYDEEAFEKVSARYRLMDDAQKRFREAVRELTPLTREKLRGLQRAAADSEQGTTTETTDANI